MTPDLPPNPPDGAPVAALVAPAPGSEPIAADSHGYHYNITGNAQLAREVIISIVEGAETPQQALDRLKAAYAQAGYPLIALRGAVSKQLVGVEVIHGRIAETDITPPSLAPYFTAVVGEEDPRRNTFIRLGAMAEFYAARDGMVPRVNFVPGQEVGSTKLVVTEEPIENASRANANLSFGNLGSRYSSRYVWQAAGAVRPGAGLELNANYGQGVPGLTADSAGSVYKSGTLGATLVTPWGLYGVSIAKTNYQLGESAAPIFPNGEITIVSLTGTQLVWASETSRLTVNEAFTHTENFVTAPEFLDENGLPFVITDQRYDMLTLGMNYNTSFAVLGQNASVGAGLVVSRGLSHPTGTLLPVDVGIAVPRFTQVQGSVNYTQSLPAGYSALLNWSGQWADATMPQNQQWVLGGFGNLTAWLPAIMVGDSGMLLRAAASTPSWQWQGITVGASAFFEAGFVHLYFTPRGAETDRALSDAGLSLTASYGTGTSLALAYAWPVAAHNVEISTLNAQGRAKLYFTLNQSF